MKRFSTQFPVCSSRREEALVPLRFEPRDGGCCWCRTTALMLLSWTFAACTVWAQGTTVFVPGGLAYMEGNSSSADLFVNGSARMVQVYSASEFNFFGAPSGRIDEIAFRLESGTGAAAGSWGVNIGLSTTTREPDSLSPVFDENGGADGVSVRLGTVLFIATNTGISPRPFEIRIPFTTPFFYDPSKGNLAVSIVTSGTRDLLLDAQLASGDSIGRVYGPNALSGTVDSLGLVTRFEIVPVPEPSILAIGAIGLLFLCVRAQDCWTDKPAAEASNCSQS
jgi:hypothetical protein